MAGLGVVESREVGNQWRAGKADAVIEAGCIMENLYIHLKDLSRATQSALWEQETYSGCSAQVWHHSTSYDRYGLHWPECKHYSKLPLILNKICRGYEHFKVFQNSNVTVLQSWDMQDCSSLKEHSTKLHLFAE